MKTLHTLTYIVIISSLIYCFSCKKSHMDNQSKEELITGKWSINKVRIDVYSSGNLIKDSVLPNTPQPENYISFKTDGTLEYKFNSPSTQVGTYYFVGQDSVYAIIGASLYKWKTLLLTAQIFNVRNTQPFPLPPGSTIETYQTFVK